MFLDLEVEGLGVARWRGTQFLVPCWGPLLPMSPLLQLPYSWLGSFIHPFISSHLFERQTACPICWFTSQMPPRPEQAETGARTPADGQAPQAEYLLFCCVEEEDHDHCGGGEEITTQICHRPEGQLATGDPGEDWRICRDPTLRQPLRDSHSSRRAREAGAGTNRSLCQGDGPSRPQGMCLGGGVATAVST